MMRELRYVKAVGSPKIRVAFPAPTGAKTLSPGDVVLIDDATHELLKGNRRFEFSAVLPKEKRQSVTMAQRLMAEVEERPKKKPKGRKRQKRSAE